MAVYDVGDSSVLTATFTVSGTNTDPTTVTLYVNDPSGNVSTYTYSGATITKSATGIYTKTIDLDEAGTWLYRWETTGTAKAAEEGSLSVQKQVTATA